MSLLPSVSGASKAELRHWRKAAKPNPQITATSQTFYGSSLRSVPRSRHNPMGSVRNPLPGDYVSPYHYAYLAKWVDADVIKNKSVLYGPELTVHEYVAGEHRHKDWSAKPVMPVGMNSPRRVCQHCFVAKPVHLLTDSICVDCHD